MSGNVTRRSWRRARKSSHLLVVLGSAILWTSCAGRAVPPSQPSSRPASVAGAEAHDGCRDRFGSDLTARARCLHARADDLLLGDLDSAEAYSAANDLHQLALSLSVRSGDRRAVAQSSSSLADFYFEMGRLSLAEEYERRTLALLRNLHGESSPKFRTRHFDLALILFHRGRYGKAQDSLDFALEHLDDAGTDEPEVLIQSLTLQSELHRVRGDLLAAERTARRALATAERTLRAEDPLRGDLLNNLAGILKDLGRYDEAQALFRRVRGIYEKDHDANYLLMPVIPLNLAEILARQGRYREAEPLYAEALDLARERLEPADPRLRDFLAQYATTLAALGRYDEAEDLYGRAVDHVAGTVGTRHPLHAQTLHDFGVTLRTAGHASAAEARLREALEVREAIFGEDHPEVAVTRSELAGILARDPERADEALAMVIQARSALSESTAFPRDRSEALALEAALLHRNGETGPALETIDRALAVVEELRPRSGGDEATRAEQSARTARWVRWATQWRLETGQIEDALAVSERGRARTLLDRLSVHGVDLRKGIPAHDRTILEDRERAATSRLTGIRVRLDSLRSAVGPLDRDRLREIARLEREMEAASRELAAVTQDLRQASPLWRSLTGRGGEVFDLEPFRREILGPDRLALVYEIAPERSWLFVISGNETAALELEVDPRSAEVLGIPAGTLTAKNLEAALLEPLGGGFGLVQLLRRARSADLVRRTRLPERLHALWEVLVPDQVRTGLLAASAVVVVPAGSLHLIPLESLVVSESSAAKRPSYWIDEGPPVVYAPSLTIVSLLRDRPPPTGSTGMLLVFDPVFETSTRDEIGARTAVSSGPTRGPLAGGRPLTRLPGTAREADVIRGTVAALGASIVELSARNATEAAVRRALDEREPDLLHFATHGLTDDSRGSPLAALALTPPLRGARGTDDDGFLQLFEIYDLELSAELTVLSACESHVGPRVVGEGVFALSRGFLVAGSRRVVASHWLVDDESTATLMGSFYRQLTATPGRPEFATVTALTTARREIRNEPAWSAPYYWAPFVAVGAP